MRYTLIRTLTALWAFATGPALAADLTALLPAPYPHSELAEQSQTVAADYLVGLGAMQKVGGRWRLKDSESIAGDLLRSTWAVAPEYTAQEAFEWVQQQLAQSTEVLFACEGRSCGSSAQWASRVFEQRLLYGHDDRQRYQVSRGDIAGAAYTWVIYAIDRANRRQYLHIDLIRHAGPATDPY